jgi:Flp pilus assembly protein TadG
VRGSRSRVERFFTDERGSALVFVAIMIPVLVGFALLAIDMSRANSLHNDLQSGADAFALAAAAELDGTADAVERANRAIDNLLTTNASNFSTAGQHTLTSEDLTVTYLTNIPASDSTALADDGVDANGNSWAIDPDAPDTARFAEITINPTAFATIFPASFLGSIDGFNVQAQAVAGFGSSVCDYTPMFICNPYTSIENLGAALAASDRRPMMLLKKQGSGGQYSPGNYGFLESPSGERSTQALKEMFASQAPRGCYSQDGVTTRTGNIPTVDDGINVRFDLYPNGNGVNALSPTTYPPAMNVRKGMVYVPANNGNGNGGNNNNGASASVASPPVTVTYASYSATSDRATIILAAAGGNSNGGGNSGGGGSSNGGGGSTQCGYRAPNGSAETSQYMSLPRDTNLDTSCVLSSTYPNCSDAPKLGDGVWDYAGYWTVNHPTDAQPTWLSTASRYDVYLYELGLNPAHPGQPASSGTEATAPHCNTASTNPKRRMLYAAVISCDPAPQGSSDIPVAAFAGIFLTEPAGGPPNADIYGELEDITGEYGQGMLNQFQRDAAQIYR